jgi:GTP-binding protein
LIVFETGTAIAYGLNNAQERGSLFIAPGTEVYSGMICGESTRGEDIEVNVCKKKHLSNTRSSGNDDALKLVTPRVMSLENCLEFINNDELVEITPHNIRMRKRILDTTMRKRAARK